MRQDMAKVIVERPRIGLRTTTPKSYKRHNQLNDNSPKHESIRYKWMRYGWQTKELNEHLQPLYRYLHKQVGRPWNDVHKEICENLRRTNAVQDHVRDHAEQYVETNIDIINGIPCYRDTKRPFNNDYRTLYVNPETGLLCESGQRRKARWKRKTTPPKPITTKTGNIIKQINGIWYEITIKKLNPSTQYKTTEITWYKTTRQFKTFIPYYDPAHHITITKESDSIKLYGTLAIGTSKRQLNTKEIKRLKLNK